MSDVVIRAENLGKKYTIGHAAQPERYTALRDVLARRMQSVFRKAKNLALGRPIIEGDELEEVWALRDVSFEVRRGEVIGVIGRNGAGKSTLLKILSLITEPSAGRVTIKGRVASLLEVGTGFHPELSGRENIFLNGAILGMRRNEIRRKFDEIVAFAEIEKFLDTPVKRYSSGMYVRLAFAVAAHLDPEILIVDEVLAVGDTEFQRKCIGKMSEVAHGGRTVLFVSHSMAAIESLTERCALLTEGQLERYAPTRETVAAYLSHSGKEQRNAGLVSWRNRTGTGGAKLVTLITRSIDGLEKAVFSPLNPIDISLTVEFADPLRADVAVVVENSLEQALFTTHLSDSTQVERWSGTKIFTVRLDPNLLRCGTYKVSLSVFSPDMTSFFDTVYHYPAFEIAGHPAEGRVPIDARWGDLYLPLIWTCQI